MSENSFIFALVLVFCMGQVPWLVISYAVWQWIKQPAPTPTPEKKPLPAPAYGKPTKADNK